MEKIDLSDFFDPYNIEHIKEYKYFLDNNKWNASFLKKNNIETPGAINTVSIRIFLSYAYVKLALDGKIIGMPLQD